MRHILRQASPPPDGVAPVLTIKGLPDGFTEGTTATVTFDWGEDVLGFIDGDIIVTGGTLGAITGGRQVWTATLMVTGTSDVVVSVADSAVQDATGTVSAATSVTGRFSSGEVAAEIIREFMGARAAASLAAQPELRDLIRGGPATGSLQVTRGAGDISLRTGTEGPVWAALSSNWTDLEGSTNAYTMLSFGSHAHISDDAIVGVMVQLDHSAFEGGAASVDGTGFLVGPYVAAEFGQIYVDGRLLWGQTENEISPLGTYTDTFQTERWLASFNLSGEVQAGGWTLLPGLGYAYTEDRQAAYVDALSNPVPAQTVRLGELTAALDWELPFANGLTDFTGGVAAIWGMQEGTADAFEGTRGRLDLGLNHQSGGLNYAFGLWVDGIGQDALTRQGAEVVLDWQF